MVTRAAATSLLLLSHSHAEVLFQDDFSAYGTNSYNLNLNLPALNGSAHPTAKVRQSGTAGSWKYAEQGADANSQLGNPATNAGQEGAPTAADYLLLAYTCQATSNLPINESLAKGEPLTISFDLGTALPGGYTDSSWWAAFRLGTAGNAYPVIGGDAGFAFLYRINKGVQIFTTGSSGVEFSGITGRRFTMVLTDTAGTGSAFSGNGSRIALYNGTTRLGIFDTAQLTEAFMNFSVQNAFASVDNLTVESGTPAFLDDAFRITGSSFNFTTGKAGLTWTSEAGKTYRVTRSATMTGPWTPAGNPIDATGDSTSTTLDFPVAERDFYRVEIVPPEPLVFDGQQIRHDATNKKVILSDASGDLQLRLSYAGRAMMDRVQVNGSETISPVTGACTGIQVGGNWATTRTLAHDPAVTVSGSDVTLSGIEYAVGGVSVRETWLLQPGAQGIEWTITRQYLNGGTLQDSYFPGWDFASSNTWTAGLLDTGGVAWSRFIGTGSSYGAHSGSTDFWKGGNGLKIASQSSAGNFLASRFSHQPVGVFTLAQSVTSQSLRPKHNLNRSISGVDLWAPFTVTAGTVQTKVSVQATDAAARRDRGTFPGIDGEAVQDVMDTIGRYGVIDHTLMGGNGWLSGYICLHEPFFGQMGLAMGDPAFTANLSTSLNAWRDHALQANGRVYSRWHHDSGDNVSPGTYNPETGYYDCGWGVLLDSQTDYPINVAEEFDLTGDFAWLQGQKEPCERALDWLLARDSDGDGLVEALTDSHTQGKSSDWIDIVWACGENALVNAKLYEALVLWSEREDLLGDSAKATTYRNAAQKLKASFIKPISQGGFWDPDKGWFAYWRNKDGSIHGNNLVSPVNFCAIAYGICSDTQRQQILTTMETKMRQENLFHWPLCFLPFAADEGGGGAFPTYENGDIFLSWGEVAIRAYAEYDPATAMAYVNRLLTQYKKDGLSYQRYLRNSQTGAGDDILAGNSMTIVGLFRNIYGIRPQWNRLMLDPHLTPELAGTQITYRLRGQTYTLSPGTETSTIAVDGLSATAATPFAASATPTAVSWFSSTGSQASLAIERPAGAEIAITVQAWPTSGLRQWSESSAITTSTLHTVRDLQPTTAYTLTIDGITSSITTDTAGVLTFNAAPAHAFTLQPG